ncbi:hypothetical protein [Chlamydia sp. 17-3921]|uniref:hypothetical protein n=1 Tax=Chlamydia sp. 17-3921 TaxID=2675798 RepID=UPI00191829A1|nr:hypothetical protein [Chlamydia sp. 17-3921]
MTISSPTQNSLDGEGIPFAMETLSEGNATAETEVTLLENSQYPIIRSMSDTCLAVVCQTGSLLSQYATTPKSPQEMKEQLLAKHDLLTKSTSLPDLTSHQSSQLKDSFPNKFTATQQQCFSSEQQKREASETSSLPYSSCLAPQEEVHVQKTIPITLQIPHVIEKESSSSSQAQGTQKQIEVKMYSEQTIKEHTTKERDTKSSEKSESRPGTSISKTSPTLSPMALFSHLQKEFQETTATKPSQEHEESQGGDQGQQESKDQEQHHSQQDRKQSSIEEISKASKITDENDLLVPYILPKPLMEFALSESQLSSLFHMRITNLDILKICAEIMKLMLNSREQETLSRIEIRKQLLAKAEELIASYERQKKVFQWLGIATAALGIIGAASPLIGEIAGDSILGFIQKNTGIWKNATSRTFFKSAGKIFSSLSQLTETASKTYELKETSARTLSEHYKEMFRIENDDVTRSIEEIKDNWKSMENFLLHILQTDHDVVRNLYQ